MIPRSARVCDSHGTVSPRVVSAVRSALAWGFTTPTRQRRSHRPSTGTSRDGPSVRRPRRAGDKSQDPPMFACKPSWSLINAAQYPSRRKRGGTSREIKWHFKWNECLKPHGMSASQRHICEGGPWVNHHPSSPDVPHKRAKPSRWLENARPIPTTSTPSLLRVSPPIGCSTWPTASPAAADVASPCLVSPRLGRHWVSLMEGFITIWASLMKGVIRASAASSQYRRRREGNRPRSRPACRRPCPSPSSSAAAASRAHTAAAAAAA